MGVARALYRDQAHQLALGHLAEHGRRQLLADQNAVVRVDQGLLPGLLQIGQQAPTEVLDVAGALAQVGVVHQFEAIDVLADHLAQGTLGPLPGADDLHHLAAQGGVFQHHQVHIEQGALFRAQLSGHLRRQGAHVRAHPLKGVIEQGQFGGDIVHRLVRHHIQIGRRQHHHRGAHGNTGRARHTDKLGFLDALALLAQTTDRTGRLGMGDHPGKLGAHGHQEGFLALVELTLLLLLDDQYAHHLAVVDDRRAEEGGVALLAGFGEVAVARVFGGVFEVERLLAGANQAHQTLVGGHADLADSLLVQALGGHQDETVGFRIKQVDRTDLAAHGLAHPLHNDAQRRLEILGGVYFLDDLAQGIEHGSTLNWLQSRTSRRGASSLRARRYTSRLNVTTCPRGYQ